MNQGPGSELFGTTIMTAEAVLVMVKSSKKVDSTESLEDVMKDIHLIDDLLVLQKSQSLMLRKRKLKDLLDARIAKELNLKHYPNFNPNERNN